MAANRTAYIIDTIRTGLESETSFTVERQWRDSMSDAKTIVYPFIASQTYTSFYESGLPRDGRATIVCYVNAKVAADPSGATGNVQQAHGIITAKIETAIYNIVLPIRDTHTGGIWRTVLNDIYVSAVGGVIDSGQTSLKAEYTIEVLWAHEKL